MTEDISGRSKTDSVALNDEEQVLDILRQSVFRLWDVVNNLTRLTPTRRPEFRVMSRATVLGAKLAARIIVGIAQLLLLLMFSHFVYALKLGHSPTALLLVSVAVVFSMASFAVIVAGLARTREQVIPVGMSVVFVLAALGGLWWPFFRQPEWLQAPAIVESICVGRQSVGLSAERLKDHATFPIEWDAQQKLLSD